MHTGGRFVVSIAGVVLLTSAPVAMAGQAAAPAAPIDRAAVEKIIAGWPNRPKLGAAQMLVKYGLPQEATMERLVWHDKAPYTRINVTRAEHPHDFPKPHMDYMEHTVMYRVPVDKTAALAAYDGSLTVDRTRGEMSARCDLEGHNILTLNLANDIVTGKLDAQGARKAFGQNVVDDALGKYPAYTTALRFTPGDRNAMFADTPVIPGSPLRVGTGKTAPAGQGNLADAEILGTIGAVDDNEIVAALQAGTKKLSAGVADYAKMLHKEHGSNLEQTLSLGQKVGVTPGETAAVDALRVKAAGELAALVPLEGERFERGFVDAMIKGHTEVIALIDGRLMSGVTNPAVKKHLADTRAAVARHLEAAKALQRK